MTKEEIYKQYAIEQGYESWRELIEDEDSVIGNLVHIDVVTDLIQEELKKKIAPNKYPYIKAILNTEIL